VDVDEVDLGCAGAKALAELKCEGVDVLKL